MTDHAVQAEHKSAIKDEHELNLIKMNLLVDRMHQAIYSIEQNSVRVEWSLNVIEHVFDRQTNS